MPGQNMHLFRPEALRRYMGRNEQAVLLKLVPPKKVALLWLLLCLLLACVLAAWLTRVPVYTPGAATLIGPGEESVGRDGSTVELLLLAEPDDLGRLAEGQRVFVWRGASNRVIEARIERVEPRTYGPEEVRARFGLEGAAARRVRAPMTVALARAEKSPGGLSALESDGFLEASIEVGTRPVVAYIPLVRRLFKG